jgi:hypothetical protein
MIVRDACCDFQIMRVTVIDDCSDWMSFDAALAHVEATQNCYEERAIRLLQEAADSLKISSRTVQGSPGWVVSGDKYYKDDGRDIQFCREDVLKLWPEQQKKAAAPRRSRSGAKTVAVELALDALYPGGVPEGVTAKERNDLVRQWLTDHRKSIPSDIAKAVQRALKRAKHS